MYSNVQSMETAFISYRGMDKDVVHIDSGILAIKNEIMPFSVTWMDLEIVILSKDRKMNSISLICVTDSLCYIAETNTAL